MKILGKAARSLPLALVAASLMMGTAPAKAERERRAVRRLFGGGIRYKPRNLGPREIYPDAPPPRRVVAAPKVTGPSYYNYKADPLVRVDFAALRAAPEKVTFEPSPTGPSISEAAAGLDGFDLFAEKDIAKAISDYYSANPQFIWVTEQQRQRARPKRRSACSARADSYGLSPADYAVTVPSAATDGGDAGGAHGRAGALRDDAVGARAALRARRPDRPHRSQPHFRLSRFPGKDRSTCRAC